ncbi:MAG: dynamin family protein [Desulfobacterales bacterium]|nr:dynamin family protein [Desulfobacterales bacterium]
MYYQNYISSLREEILKIVENYLTPIAIRYNYSDLPLQESIKWLPLVLVIGNYSSGKSTLINEFIGAKVQATGQAPTDDSFTVITGDDTEDEEIENNSNIEIIEERDGKFLLNDPQFPFSTLKKYGQRFSSHFCLKKVNSPLLKNLAIIDTPGMLDSVSERDRGYDYQEVIGDIAEIADLVLVLFDPHKAGTVRELYVSLRNILPSKTFEDRVLFVLNRVDECASLMDLLRVYGTLCWNLSQITGRKDIPSIHLTHVPNSTIKNTNKAENIDSNKNGYLNYLENHRDELKKAILKAPSYHLDKMASFVETHAERLAHFLEALINYQKKYKSFKLKFISTGFFSSLIAGALGVYMQTTSGTGYNQFDLFISAGGTIALIFMLLWMTIVLKLSDSRFKSINLKTIDELTSKKNQQRIDTWDSIKEIVHNYIVTTKGKFSLGRVKKDYTLINGVIEEASKEIREGLRELNNLDPEEEIVYDEESDGKNIKNS